MLLISCGYRSMCFNGPQQDEAHTLPRTLMPLKPYLDYYYILDTGSTDGTQASIRQTLGEKGEIFEVCWHDRCVGNTRGI